MNTQKTEPKFWTIAYRNKNASRVVRKDMKLTWREAVDEADKWIAAHNDGKHEVYYVTNVQAERSGYVPAEDIGNVMSATGKRIKMEEEKAETKILPGDYLYSVLCDGVWIPVIAGEETTCPICDSHFYASI